MSLKTKLSARSCSHGDFFCHIKIIIMKMVYYFCIFLALLCFLLLGFVYIRIITKATLEEMKQRTGVRKVIGFFHPFCDAGGGGEKVLF